MSFEWQSAQFEVHHDPKLLKWRMKSLSHMPKLYRDGNQLSWMRQRSVSMLTSFLHNCYFSWTLLMLLFLGVGKDLCKIYCWELFRFYFFVDYKKQWRLKKKAHQEQAEQTPGTPWPELSTLSLSSHPSVDFIALSAARSERNPPNHNLRFLAHN